MNANATALAGVDPAAIAALIEGRHGDPFAILGPHRVEGGLAVRAFLPEARLVEVVARGGGAVLGRLACVHPDGLFAGLVSEAAPYRLRIGAGADRRLLADPYAFEPLLGALDLHLIAEGLHQDLAQVLGAHITDIDGEHGARFAVWAPNARRVSVVGDFNRWDGRVHPMRRRHGPGVWELFIPGLSEGVLYKYELLGPDGAMLPLKADPVAWQVEAPPRTAAIVPDPASFVWTDAAWLSRRAACVAADAPVSVYEVHAASWMRDGADSWDALADRLVPYLVEMGFTHVEFLPVMAHPFGGSWGYQPLGLYAPDASLGPPAGFAGLVDRCHAAEIGVILDWVPAHFPTDAYGLARFDGTALYEHQDPREGFHRDWNTLIYNLGRNEVRGFLIGSALHWLEHYHVDGLRVDAVASMLYRDYSRPADEWIPNHLGGRENFEAIHFLQELSRIIAGRCPGTVLIAEESTAWPAVTRPADKGGLGFTYKWNMGWMHDTLEYMAHDSVHRPWHHDQMTFGLVYAFSERFVLPLSHDEVVHGKRSLLGRMPGDEWQRFANLRAYFGFMWTHPGKKLLFMGCELADWREWDHDRGLDWRLAEYPPHHGVQTLVRDLNRLYRETPALHRHDCSPDGFRWVVIDDQAQSVYAWLRFGAADDAPVLVVCNFTPMPRHRYRLGVPRAGVWGEKLNTDSACYGGSDLGNGGKVVADDIASHGMPASLSLTLPPLATLILRAE